ncbi:MAG TPA: apolipoprotein N-acyltransferase, partial [Gammaproteobacteria bacterium]|nr:apolipoprotein N-acyltransferase [Gammaproteobacteria bacterium]
MGGAARLKLFLALAAGAALPLAYAPFSHYALAPVCLALLMLVWARATPGQAFLLGFAFGFASFLAGMYWVYISIHDFGGAHPLLAGFLTLALVTILSLFPGFVGWVAARWFALRGPAAWLGAVPALWVLAEWLRGWVFSGMGWLAVGYSQIDSWLVGYAPLGGVYLTGWMVLLSAGALVTLSRSVGRARAGAALGLAAVWLAAYFLAQQRWTEPNSDIVTVALVQGAVSQDLKWQSAQLAPTLELYRDLTAQAAPSDLVIWPEAAIPALYERIESYLDEVRALAAGTGGSVLLGVLRQDPDTGAVQNALVSLDGRPSFYIKRHLVPYGEYFPVPDFVRDWLRVLDLPYTDIRPGPPDQPPLNVAGQKLAVTICYEDLFGAEQLHYMPDATLLVNVSNDAWFGDSIAPHQHLDIARFRAAEVGRYLLRATNTGITAIVDPSGGIVARAPQFEPHLLRGAVQGLVGSTPYARWGNYAVVVLALLVLAIQRA